MMNLGCLRYPAIFTCKFCGRRKHTTKVCIRTSSVANLLASITGLWNSISITDVPNAILFVFASYIGKRVSSGSNTFWPSTGKLPSGVPGYGVCGSTSHKSLSPTQRESIPSCSAIFAVWITFSLVACWPKCGNEIPIFKLYTDPRNCNFLEEMRRCYGAGRVFR